MRASSDPGFRAWSLIVDINALLTPMFTKNLKEIGMSMSHFDVLVNLLIAGDQQTGMGDLADRAVISLSRVSRVVDELEAQGLVERSQDPTDGRAVILRLRQSGRDHLKEAVKLHAEDVRELFSAHLTESQGMALIDALEAVLRAHGRTPSPTEAWDT